MREFIEEVNEELRWEKILKFWQTYGTYLVLVILAFFAGLSGWLYWTYTQEQSRIRTAAHYEKAIALAETGELDQSFEMLKALGEKDKAGYGFLARLKMAALYPDKQEENSAIYQKLEADPSLEKTFQELATITDILHQLDTARPIDLAARLRPIESGISPWRATATELLGLLLVKAGNIPKALEVYENLSRDDRSIPGIRARSSAMIDFLRRTER